MMAEESGHIPRTDSRPEIGPPRVLTTGRLAAIVAVLAAGAAMFVLVSLTIALEPWWGPATRTLRGGGSFVKEESGWKLVPERSVRGTPVQFERREHCWPSSVGFGGPYLTVRDIEYRLTGADAPAPDRGAATVLIEQFFAGYTPNIRPGDIVSARARAVDFRLGSAVLRGMTSGWPWLAGVIALVLYCVARLTFLCDRYRSVRRLRLGLCPSCAYSLDSRAGDICPECGTSPREIIDRLSGRKRPRALRGSNLTAAGCSDGGDQDTRPSSCPCSRP